ncbi:integral membrane protein [Candidatus Endolissoclinum faulkneri L5]|uniref:Integral membrane protein n=1 Tax=Candidatus Endolissoclinum faulkneri L5 TaxID=1401328 RepID=V9TVG2_9PROT|nr:Bax inhibitor-1/YccA family protein [Candidatus Endolissoclinum faulkneri]AHC73310.1 integral membrane protein [Candidatus Endolissoclinum faulkneri L5]
MNYDRQTMSRSQADVAGYDVGLRQYMLGVYNHMVAALILTGVVASGTAMLSFQDGSLTSFGEAVYMSELRWVIMLAPIAMVLLISARVASMSLSSARILFYVFSSLMGLSLASIFLVYAAESIARVFFITAAAFAGLSLYGYTTKKILSGLGTFAVMGLFGVMLASIVNIFLASSALQFTISIAGVLVFSILTAYDTQRIKEMYNEIDSFGVVTKKTIIGALTLYLDFINLFLFLLRLFGNRE